jgi:hypothetical protein
MQSQELSPLEGLFHSVSEYLPTLAAGVLILALGVAAGWVAKRTLIRVLMWLRLDRLGGRYGWKSAFGKGDVRAALYNILGNVTMLLVFLIFLDDALQTLRLQVLSRMLDQVVFFLPRLALAAFIAGVGLGLANLSAVRIEDALEEEHFTHARLLGRMSKGVLLSIIGALAVWELGLAHEIVLAAFLIAFGAIGVAFAVAVGLGSAGAIQRGWQDLFEKREDD